MIKVEPVQNSEITKSRVSFAYQIALNGDLQSSQAAENSP
jgi:hypothetical protein